MKSAGRILLVALCLGGCKKKVDMIVPDSGTTATAAPSASATTATADSSSAAPSSDDLAPLASLNPTKPAPPVVGVAAKPHASGSAAAVPTGAATPPAGAPPECAAALVMQKAGRQKEYDTLKGACLAKGGKL